MKFNLNNDVVAYGKVVEQNTVKQQVQHANMTVGHNPHLLCCSQHFNLSISAET